MGKSTVCSERRCKGAIMDKKRFLLLQIDATELEKIETKPIGIFFDFDLAEEMQEREKLHYDELGIEYTIIEI